MRDLHPLGQMPPLGEVPARMLAQLIRPERFGEPTKAFQVEEVEVPADLRPDEVLVWVMAAGVNYNNVWAALGVPVDVIKGRQKDPDYRPFHIGGSDASGIVWKVGGAVRNVAVGDHVVIHCGTWDPDDAVVRAGGDPMFGASVRRRGLGGPRRAQEPAPRLRAPGRGHRPDVDLRVRHGRHGRHLRGDDGLQRGRRPPLPLDAPEALPGLALRQRRPGASAERPRRRGEGRSVPVRDVHLRPDPSRPPADAREPPPPRQHGVPGERAAPQPAPRPAAGAPMAIETVYTTIYYVDDWERSVASYRDV